MPKKLIKVLSDGVPAIIAVMGAIVPSPIVTAADLLAEFLRLSPQARLPHGE